MEKLRSLEQTKNVLSRPVFSTEYRVLTTKRLRTFWVFAPGAACTGITKKLLPARREELWMTVDSTTTTHPNLVTKQPASGPTPLKAPPPRRVIWGKHQSSLTVVRGAVDEGVFDYNYASEL
jgi:hypothetical protein